MDLKQIIILITSVLVLLLVAYYIFMTIKYYNTGFYNKTKCRYFKIVINSNYRNIYLVYLKLLKKFQQEDIYVNLYIPNNRNYVHIDLLIMTDKELYVINVKNYQGNIKGSEEIICWSQTINNKEYEFLNPYLENEKRRIALKEYLGSAFYQIKNIIVFNDNANLTQVNVDNGFITTTGNLYNLIEKLETDIQRPIQSQRKSVARNLLDLYVGIFHKLTNKKIIVNKNTVEELLAENKIITSKLINKQLLNNKNSKLYKKLVNNYELLNSYLEDTNEDLLRNNIIGEMIEIEKNYLFKDIDWYNVNHLKDNLTNNMNTLEDIYHYEYHYEKYMPSGDTIDIADYYVQFFEELVMLGNKYPEITKRYQSLYYQMPFQYMDDNEIEMFLKHLVDHNVTFNPTRSKEIPMHKTIIQMYKDIYYQNLERYLRNQLASNNKTTSQVNEIIKNDEVLNKIEKELIHKEILFNNDYNNISREIYKITNIFHKTSMLDLEKDINEYCFKLENLFIRLKSLIANDLLGIYNKKIVKTFFDYSGYLKGRCLKEVKLFD